MAREKEITSPQEAKLAFETLGYDNEYALRKAVLDVLIQKNWNPRNIGGLGHADIFVEREGRFLLIELKLPKVPKQVDEAIGQILRYSLSTPPSCVLMIVFEGGWASGAAKLAQEIIERYKLPIEILTAYRFAKRVEADKL